MELSRENIDVFTVAGSVPQTVLATWQRIWEYFDEHPQIERRFSQDFEAYEGADKNRDPHWCEMTAMSTKKSWRDKLAGHPDLPVVKPIPDAMKKRRGDGTIAIPSPREVDAAMRNVPPGRVATVFGIGEAIAARHKATIGCTVTTAIFAHMAAHAAEEARLGGDRDATAWWRTVKVDGGLNPKYPGGIDRQISQLQTEGHRILQRGKRFFVADFEDKLAEL